MQGRLSPPFDGRVQFFPTPDWKAEFSRAAEAGFTSIEWLYDTASKGVNPIETETGRAEIDEITNRTGIAVNSLCAHFFVENPLVRGRGAELEDLLETLTGLISYCGLARVERLVLPFLENGGIRSAEDEHRAKEVISEIVSVANAARVEIHLECDLAPREYARFLDRLPHSIRVLYDTGNSTAGGYKVEDEMAAYASRIGSVHLKDRMIRGKSVPLGKGEANLGHRIESLLTAGYQGDFILEAARGETGQEVEWAKRNLSLVRSLVEEIHSGAASQAT